MITYGNYQKNALRTEARDYRPILSRLTTERALPGVRNSYFRSLLIKILEVIAPDLAPQLPRELDRTEARLLRLMHASLGMGTEVGELSLPMMDFMMADKVNVIEECGDLLWYCAIACDAAGFPFPGLPYPECSITLAVGSTLRLLSRLSKSAGDVQDVVKRAIFYGTEVDSAKIETSVKEILSVVDAICFKCHVTIVEAMIMNIAKLRKRFPGKFTEEAAVSRYLDAERKVLESYSGGAEPLFVEVDASTVKIDEATQYRDPVTGMPRE